MSLLKRRTSSQTLWAKLGLQGSCGTTNSTWKIQEVKFWLSCSGKMKESWWWNSWREVSKLTSEGNAQALKKSKQRILGDRPNARMNRSPSLAWQSHTAHRSAHIVTMLSTVSPNLPYNSDSVTIEFHCLGPLKDALWGRLSAECD